MADGRKDPRTRQPPTGSDSPPLLHLAWGAAAAERTRLEIEPGCPFADDSPVLNPGRMRRRAAGLGSPFKGGRPKNTAPVPLSPGAAPGSGCR